MSGNMICFLIDVTNARELKKALSGRTAITRATGVTLLLHIDG